MSMDAELRQYLEAMEHRIIGRIEQLEQVIGGRVRELKAIVEASVTDQAQLHETARRHSQQLKAVRREIGMGEPQEPSADDYGALAGE